MGFFGQDVWIIGYCGLMGYGMGIPAYQSCRIAPLWVFGGYGLFTLWVMRGSTVIILPRGSVPCTMPPREDCDDDHPSHLLALGDR